jgi:hypothetical protein
VATEQGLRFALGGLPTPGDGLDDQDRYALAGIYLSTGGTIVESSTYAQGWRFALAGLTTPGDAFDTQDRFGLQYIPYPEDLEEPQVVFEIFETTYFVRPTSVESLVGDDQEGRISLLIGSFFVETFSEKPPPPGDPIVLPFKVLLGDPITKFTYFDAS